MGTCNNVRVIRCMTRSFNPFPTQLVEATNKGAAATAYVKGMQVALARELDSNHNCKA